MAKNDNDLFDRLTAAGMRKKVARKVTRAAEEGGKKRNGRVEGLLDDLQVLTEEARDLVTGGPAKRSAASKKAARTRKRSRAARSTAAKKAARTRATSARRWFRRGSVTAPTGDEAALGPSGRCAGLSPDGAGGSGPRPSPAVGGDLTRAHPSTARCAAIRRGIGPSCPSWIEAAGPSSGAPADTVASATRSYAGLSPRPTSRPIRSGWSGSTIGCAHCRACRRAHGGQSRGSRPLDHALVRDDGGDGASAERVTNLSERLNRLEGRSADAVDSGRPNRSQAGDRDTAEDVSRLSDEVGKLRSAVSKKRSGDDSATTALTQLNTRVDQLAQDVAELSSQQQDELNNHSL